MYGNWTHCLTSAVFPSCIVPLPEVMYEPCHNLNVVAGAGHDAN